MLGHTLDLTQRLSVWRAGWESEGAQSDQPAGPPSSVGRVVKRAPPTVWATLRAGHADGQRCAEFLAQALTMLPPGHQSASCERTRGSDGSGGLGRAGAPRASSWHGSPRSCGHW
ncbi:MAG: hypothetical protein IPK92_14825 [Nitrospira sp.]|nr:hypothetical protein [Nitrospira sp.]